MERLLTNTTKAELLLKAQQLKALDRPSNRDYRSVLSFMEYEGGQLYEEDMEFIYEKEDLVTLRPGREYAWLDGMLERTLKVLRCKLVKVSLYLGLSHPDRALTFPVQFFFCPKVSILPRTQDPMCLPLAI